jgi:Skp family chaperone for outer membrane proteins
LGLGAIALAGYFAGSAEAQQSNAPAAQPSVLGRTRVAFINLHEVLKHYHKYTAHREVLKAKDQEYVNTLKAKQQRLEALAKEAKDEKTTQARKEQIEKEAKQIQFDMNEIKAEAQKTLVKYHDENVAQIYREVYQVVTQYAQANGIDVVLRYNEDWGEDYHTPQKVVGRMSLPFFPMYYHPSLEITGPVRDELNKRFASAAPAPAAGSGVVPAGANK